MLLPLLGFALVYGLPMLGLDFAVDHGLYVASAATVAPLLRLAPAAYWVDESGAEHELESITPCHSFPGWKLVRFTDDSMDAALVQERHIVVRTPLLPIGNSVEGGQTVDTLPLGSQEKVEGVRQAHTLFRGSPAKDAVIPNQPAAHHVRDVTKKMEGYSLNEDPSNSHRAVDPSEIPELVDALLELHAGGAA
ncbi:hypothetical protein [Rhodococcus zopfii]|uniref:hypothetical protein n=1 Tax=Rhodococcus zopfii TaxID=43772 RepID=UPI0035285778